MSGPHKVHICTLCGGDKCEASMGAARGTSAADGGGGVGGREDEKKNTAGQLQRRSHLLGAAVHVLAARPWARGRARTQEQENDKDCCTRTSRGHDTHIMLERGSGLG
jgi:hypothetical protein